MSEIKTKKCYTCHGEFKKGDTIYNMYYGLMCKACRDAELFAPPPDKKENDDGRRKI